MSTFFATFDDLDRTTDLVKELLANGVSADSISVVSRQVKDGVIGSEWIENDSTGDATAFVGGPDDPIDEQPLELEDKLASLSTGYVDENTNGIDTSNIDNDVESVDQNEDSQEASEDMLYPPKNISNSTHETDDMALTMLTGFPTAVTRNDDVQDRSTELLDGLQTVTIPEAGTVIGGGGLATAALDAFNPDQSEGFSVLRAFLKDEGVTDESVHNYVAALEQGSVLVGIEVKPSSAQEEFIEGAVERSGGQNAQLFDAPRYYNQASGEKGYAF